MHEGRATTQVHLNPAMEVSDLPLKNFYRYSLPAFAGRPGAVSQPAVRMLCPAVASPPVCRAAAAT